MITETILESDWKIERLKQLGNSNEHNCEIVDIVLAFSDYTALHHAKNIQNLIS
jgi:hypothetical protein